MKISMALLLSILSFSVLASDWRSQIIEDAKSLYLPESQKEFQKPLQFKIIDSSLPAASARHDFEGLSVEINTGLLNSPRLSPDSFRMIICHELGHLFGGAPRKNVPPEWDGPVGEDGLSLMSCEGQADYYAGSVCFKRLIAISSSRDEITEAGPVLKSKCQNLAGKKGKDYDDCVRGANGGQGFLNLVMDFPISCELEDQEIASDLIRDSYPGRQCRLDTIVNASLCSEKLPLSMHPSDDTKNSCKALFAKRPACWFPAH